MAFSQYATQKVGDHTVTVRHAKYRDSADTHLYPDWLFTTDFSIATETGFIRVWGGSYVLLKYLEENDAVYGISKGANCIELGSGAGLLGLCMAAMGANVVLTDVLSSIDCITKHNIVLNAQLLMQKQKNTNNTTTDAANADVATTNGGENKAPVEGEAAAQAKDEASCTATATTEEDEKKETEEEEVVVTPPPPPKPTPITGFFAKAAEAYAVGNGSAGALALDWNEPISNEVFECCPEACDYIIACECLFLPELAEMCIKVVGQLLKKCRPTTKALFAYSHRDTSGAFVGPEDVERHIAENGMAMKWLMSQEADPEKKDSFKVSLIEAHLIV